MPEAGLPAIVILATGGTIAGAKSNASAAGYTAGTLGIEELLAAVPQLPSLARLRAEQIANVGSQDMRHDVWHALAHRIDTLCREGATDGMVITHGTDTLEETAYFLSLVVPHDVPVVLVGAMRPADALGAEGPANLYYAVALAAHGEARGRGPLVVMNEDIHYAREVQKMAAAGLCAFASPNRGRAGVMQGALPVFYSRNATVHTSASAFSIGTLPAAAQWPRVGIVYAHADLQGDIIDFMADRCAGLVLAGVGGGNATAAAMRALRAAADRGVAVVRASRAASGYVARNVEVNDDTENFIAARDLSPQKARILLTLALTSTREPAALQRLFDAY